MFIRHDTVDEHNFDLPVSKKNIPTGSGNCPNNQSACLKKQLTTFHPTGWFNRDPEFIAYNNPYKIGYLSSPTNPLNNQGPFFHCSNGSNGSKEQSDVWLVHEDCSWHHSPQPFASFFVHIKSTAWKFEAIQRCLEPLQDKWSANAAIQYAPKNMTRTRSHRANLLQDFAHTLGTFPLPSPQKMDIRCRCHRYSHRPESHVVKSDGSSPLQIGRLVHPLLRPLRRDHVLRHRPQSGVQIASSLEVGARSRLPGQTPQWTQKILHRHRRRKCRGILRWMHHTLHDASSSSVPERTKSVQASQTSIKTFRPQASDLSYLRAWTLHTDRACPNGWLQPYLFYSLASGSRPSTHQSVGQMLQLTQRSFQHYSPHSLDRHRPANGHATIDMTIHIGTSAWAPDLSKHLRRASAEAFPHLPRMHHSRHHRHRESHPEHTRQKRTGAKACEACVPMIPFLGWAARRSAAHLSHREVLHKCRRALHRCRPQLHFCRFSWRNPVTTLRAEHQSLHCCVSPLLRIRPDSHQREAAVLAKLFATETEKDPTSLSSHLRHFASFGLLVSQRMSEAAPTLQWAPSATQGQTWQGLQPRENSTKTRPGLCFWRFFFNSKQEFSYFLRPMSARYQPVAF